MRFPKTGSIHLPFLISSECLEMAVIKNYSQQDSIRTRAKDMTSECGSAASVLWGGKKNDLFCCGGGLNFETS